MPFQLRPDAILTEVKAFNDKLAQGMTNLMELGEISSGVTLMKSCTVKINCSFYIIWVRSRPQ